MRKRWIVAIKREEGPNFTVTKNTVVCSEHFRQDDFVDYGQTDVPTGNAEGDLPKRRVQRRLKRGTVPSVFSFRPPTVERPSPRKRQRDAEERRGKYVHLKSLPKFGPVTKEEHLQSELELARKRIATLEGSVDRLTSENRFLKSQVLRFENVRLEDKMLSFFTGLSRDIWDILWTFLKPEGNILSSKSATTDKKGRQNSYGAGRKSILSLQDQLLMTLIRLRLGTLEQVLSYQFGVSISSVSRTVVKWINYLYLRLGLIPTWPKWEAVEASMPDAFRRAYPDTFCIVDATELRCEIPSMLSLQSQHYSSYKSHTTVKGLVAIAPNGTFVFISQLFTGAISDRQLFEESGILPLLELVPRGKSIMADRGFEVQDLLVKSGLLLNAPPFKGSRTSLTEEEVKKTQRIARLRIHVERAIGQVKRRFRIFDGVLPMVLSGSANQIWTVCCLLMNFGGPLIMSEDEDSMEWEKEFFE